MKTICVDANIILRLLINDKSNDSTHSFEIFYHAERGTYKIFIDQITIAEVVWVLSSYYKQNNLLISDSLTELIKPKWIICPYKKRILRVLKMFKESQLSFIDCWLFVVCKSKKISLETFDHKLLKKFKQYN